MTEEDKLKQRRDIWFSNAMHAIKDPSIAAIDKKDIENKMKLLNKHEYWENQEVKPFLQECNQDGLYKSSEFIIKKYKHENPAPLPPGFEWTTVDLSNDEELEKVYEVLKQNFVEDRK